jgi:hypothetical protein
MLRRLLWAACVAVAPVGFAQAADRYAAPSAPEARDQALAWVAEQGVTDQAVLEAVAGVWTLDGEVPAGREVFDRVVQTLVLVDADAKRFVESCSLVNPPLVPPETKAVFEKPSEFASGALRQFYATFLTERRMYDEALEQFAQLDPAKSLDPASYFYFKAVAEHQLLMKTEGLETVATLLGKVENVPVRYEAVASLMKHELEALQVDSLDEVARKMSDVERRLDLARAGEKVQKREDEIIATLDEIIEKLEQQGGS